MKIDFSERWWIGKNEPINPIDPDAARRRHIRHDPYVAIVGGSENPRCVVDFAIAWVSVIFLDDRRRQYLRYDFEVRDSERLFLKTAYHWEHGDHDHSPISTKIFSFAEDGHVTMEMRDAGTGNVENREIVASVSGNWERYPNFAAYDFLCNETRDQITPLA